MNHFGYTDKEVGSKEIAFTVASAMIGVTVLTIPRLVAKYTESSDGWISIVGAGLTAIILAVISVKLASRFPKMTFTDYAGKIATKPVGYLLTGTFFVYFLLTTAFIVRTIASIGKQYLFDKTPVEVIALVFLLVVIYAVSGDRMGILRLAILFLPFVLIVTLILIIFSTGFVDHNHYLPVLITRSTGLFIAAKDTIYAMLGFEIVLIYVGYMNRPEKAMKAAIIGCSIPILLYLIVYLLAVGTFSVEVVRQSAYPTIELAKEVRFPGEFFERFESLFFVIWIMNVFNTASFTYDAAVYSLQSVFPKVKKRMWVRCLAPVIYLIGLMPKTVLDLVTFGQLIGLIGLLFVGIVPTTLLIVAKVRGVHGNGT